MKAIKILGIGAFAPETVITNDDISKVVDTSDEWIFSRTGIRNRRVVSGNETSVGLAVKAAQDALGFAGVDPSDVECIIVATSMPDNLYPSTACEVQRDIGASNAIAFDVVAACSGLLYAQSIASQFLRSGTYKSALIIGVDIHSRFIDWSDRGTCILFGDAAGAFYMVSDDNLSEDELLAIELRADGTKAKELRIPLTGKNCCLVEQNEQKPPFVYMNGKEIYKFAVQAVPQIITQTLEKAGLGIDQIDFLIPHQANMRIITAISDKLGIPMEKVLSNLENYGNTSTASIPLALLEAIKDGRVKNGKTLVLTGFGAGLTWGASVIKWNAEDKRI